MEMDETTKKIYGLSFSLLAVAVVLGAIYVSKIVEFVALASQVE
jgi:hypothetical protein